MVNENNGVRLALLSLFGGKVLKNRTQIAQVRADFEEWGSGFVYCGYWGGKVYLASAHY